MAAELVLLDTSIWIEFFNRPERPEALAVKELIEQDRAVLAGVILAELIQGARTKKERDLLAESLGILPFVETDREDWREAGVLLNDLRTRGFTLPLTDALLAQLCLRHHLAIFTLDKHFYHFRNLMRFRMEAIK